MKLGLIFTLQDPPNAEHLHRLYDEVFEQAELAESLGFDAFFLPEHHQMPDGYLPQPLTFAAALAARTKKAEIGTSILQLPMYHPLHVAEQKDLHPQFQYPLKLRLATPSCGVLVLSLFLQGGGPTSRRSMTGFV